MIENENTLQCTFKHQLPIVQVILNPQLSKEQRLLCIQCLDNVDIQGKVVGFNRIIQMIEENQKQKLNLVENMIIQNIQQIEQIKILINQMKSNIIQQLEQLNIILKDWITNLKSIGMKYSQYSFHEELENIITKNNNTKFNSNSLIKDINIEYNNSNFKAKSQLEQFNQFPEYKKCQQVLYDLQRDIIKYEFQITQVSLLQEGDIKVKLIDQSVKQVEYCYSIVFNFSGKIMVSTNQKIIKVWNFNNGRIQLLHTLEQHNEWVTCLIYSRIKDAFISGSSDKTIRIWKLKKQNQWFSSQSYQLHSDSVYCLILNQNEDQLFSGGSDKSIKVWQLDFSNDKLIYQYSLDKHQNAICALSLNQSESLLVSCGDGKNEIIIWERGNKNKMKFKYIVKQSISYGGRKVKFIKENQFIWVSCEIDKIYIFEMKEGVLQENKNKQIQLNQNNSSFDYIFPIIYNKQKNLIIVRHKCYIYIIRELNNGQFKIVKQLEFNSNNIYGMITNNGQYLVCWDDNNLIYSTYELFYD